MRKTRILLIWRYRKISTKKRNYSAVLNVPLNSQILIIWRYIKISTQMKNHSAALNVPLNWWILLIWRCMKIRTKMKNHPAANIACQVCSNLLNTKNDILIWKSMKENAWGQLNDLSTVWIFLCLFKWFDIQHLQSHWEQLNGVSLLWVLSCLFKLPYVEHLTGSNQKVYHLWGCFLVCLDNWTDIQIY